MRLSRSRFLLAAALLAAGCASPEARNENNPDLYTSLTPQQQALVRAGQVAPGFDEDAVRLSIGEPDRITARTDDKGDVSVWHFTAWEADGKPLFTGTYHADRRHGLGWNGWWGPAYAYYLDYPNRVIKERYNVEFRDGRVTAVIREPQ